MPDNPTLRQRLSRRETWTQIVGYALAILWPIFHAFGVHEVGEPVMSETVTVAAKAIHAALAAGIIGAGTVAQISRAEQRAEDAFYRVPSTAAQTSESTSHPPGLSANAPTPPLTPDQVQAAHVWAATARQQQATQAAAAAADSAAAVAAHAAQPDAHHAAHAPPEAPVAAPPTQTPPVPPNAA